MAIEYLVAVMMPCLSSPVACLAGMQLVVGSSVRSCFLTSPKTEPLPANYSSIVDCAGAPQHSD